MLNRIIYLDSENLNSCFSQLCDGVESKRISNNSNTSTKSKELLGKAQTTGKASLGIFGAGLNGGIGSTISATGITGLNTSSETIVERCPFDDIHNILLDHLTLKNKLKTNLGDVLIGDIVNVTGEITLISKKMLSDLDSKQGAIELLLNSLGSEAAIGGSLKELSNGLKVLDFLIPYDVFAKIGDCIVVLKKECFRTGTEISPHMFGGQATVLGYATNEICKNCISDDNVFSRLISAMNASLCGVLGCEKMKVICPISIYYK